MSEIKMSAEVQGAFDSLTGKVTAMKDESLQAVNEVKKELAAERESAKEAMNKMEERLNITSVRSGIEKDPQKGFKNHVDFFNQVIECGKNHHNPTLWTPAVREYLNVVGADEAKIANDPDGGFLIPEAFMPGIMKTDSQLLQTDTGSMTRKIPMQSEVVKLNARVDKTHTSSVSGGFQVYRREEAATVTASKAQYEQIKLEANSLMGISYATEEIISRSPMSFAALVQSGFAEERISKLNDERLNGTGVGQYLGVNNSAALITAAKVTDQTADTIVAANIYAMRARCYGYNNAVWMANQDTFPALAAMSDASGNKLWQQNLRDDVPDMLMGRPVIFDENLATLGDAGDIMLINWNEYLEGQLGGVEFADSTHVRFVYNERAFKFNVYNDGAPWWRSALTPKNSTKTLSPFVTLAERA